MDNDNYNSLGRIIIADDETTFCKSTAKLLQNAGFACDCVKNGTEALQQIENNDYNLLIADIKMPGNAELQLVKTLAESAVCISIILVTAYPSQQTAIQAVGLPITVYLTKPIDFAELMNKIKSAIKINRLHRIVSQVRRELQTWTQHLQQLETTLTGGKYESLQTCLENFLETTSLLLNNIFSSIKNATDLISNTAEKTQVCQLMQCPKLSELTEGVEQAIKTIKQSRQIHRSKQLEGIRVKLEKLLNNIQKN